MFQYYVYNELTKEIAVEPIRPDDRDFQNKCWGAIHEFAPGSKSCTCDKYKNFKHLRYKDASI